MAQDDFEPKLGHIKDARRARAQRHAAQVFSQAGKHGARAVRQLDPVTPDMPSANPRVDQSRP